MAGSGLLAHGVPNQPPFLRIIKYVVLLLSLLVLAMGAWSLSVFGQYSYYLGAGSGGLLIFVAIKTFIIMGVALYLEMAAPQHFYRIIMLIAYAVSIVFWLSAWAWSASLAGLWLSAANDYCDSTYEDCSIFTPEKNEGSALAAGAALGAVTWVLLIVHFVFFVIACLRDPQGTAVAPQQAELGQVKAQEAYPAQQPYPQQPYPQQPAPAQYQQQPTYAEQPYQQQPQQTYPTQ